VEGADQGSDREPGRLAGQDLGVDLVGEGAGHRDDGLVDVLDTAAGSAGR
jgi:hypothetical protein